MLKNQRAISVTPDYNDPDRRSACVLTDNECSSILNTNDSVLTGFLSALRIRVLKRISSPGLLGLKDNTTWWYVVFEYISDAAFYYHLYNEKDTGIWLKNCVLSIIRKNASDWAGPWFRDHTEPLKGHLETAHLNWAIAAAIDLASDIFDPSELEEIKDELLNKGINLCKKWVEGNHHLANWRGIMISGIVVPAAVLGEKEILKKYVPELNRCLEAFQPDGSYAESLQYGNYLSFSLMLAYEFVYRRYPSLASKINITAYAKGLQWIVSSMFYAKPLSGFGAEPRARAANFNDSAAIFRPSGDLLLHISARCKENSAEDAALAKWLFQHYYEPVPGQEPNNLASFGFVNDWGFLSLVLYLQSSPPVSPADVKLPLTIAFSNGNAFIRDSWHSKTVIAIQGGAEALHGPGHLHGDVNSFILVHNKERLLIDPGHSCYRNLIHGVESSSQAHNTCTFNIKSDKLGLQEDLAKSVILQQNNVPDRRVILENTIGNPVVRGNKTLICSRSCNVSVIGSEAAALYGEPITEFSRFWISGGSNVLFVVDRILSSQPVITIWNWLFNNRDGNAYIERINPDGLQVSRPLAGLKMIKSEKVKLSGPVFAYAHDYYHPEPNQQGEGKPGTGLLYNGTENNASVFRVMVHAFCFDNNNDINGWHIQCMDNKYLISSREQNWIMEVRSEENLQVSIQSTIGDTGEWTLQETDGEFILKTIK